MGFKIPYPDRKNFAIEGASMKFKAKTGYKSDNNRELLRTQFQNAYHHP